MKKIVLAFVAGAIGVAGGGYALNFWQPTDPMIAKDEPASERRDGIFRKQETIAVGELLNGIREVNQLVVFKAYLTATTTTHDIGWITQTDQTMLTPAFVNYYIDLSKVDQRAVKIDGDVVHIAKLPIMIERPNIDSVHQQIFNNGIWSNLASVSEQLRARNNKMASRQLIQRAKMPFLKKAAREAANRAQELNVRHILEAKGYKNMTVRFDG